MREIIGNATLYLGDCREILPSVSGVDAVVSDVPYGIGERTDRKRKSRGFRRGLQGGAVDARDWPAVVGDDCPFDPAPLLKYPKVVLFGANHYCDRLPGRPHWIIWDKREETGPDANADCEIAWTNLPGPARIHRQLWRGICRRGEELRENGGRRLHPTQKPIALMDFCLRACKLEAGQLVADPYMGSGSTGVAAVRGGLRFIGIEAVPEYFKTACRRIEDAQRTLFAREAA
jgi:site-specific DNA-methyltransferase (adenine-specific)